MYTDDETDTIVTLIEKGEKLTFPERSSDWRKCVISNASYGYTIIIENALEIMKALEEGATIEEAQEMLRQQGHSGATYVAVCDTVLVFSEKGKDLWEQEMDKTPLSAQRLAWYAQTVHENTEYAKNKAERKAITN